MNTRTDILQSSYARGRTSFAEQISSVWHTLALWHERARERRALAELPAELLKDIGVSRAEAMREAQKPFWKD